MQHLSDLQLGGQRLLRRRRRLTGQLALVAWGTSGCSVAMTSRTGPAPRGSSPRENDECSNTGARPPRPSVSLRPKSTLWCPGVGRGCSGAAAAGVRLANGATVSRKKGSSNRLWTLRSSAASETKKRLQRGTLVQEVRASPRKVSTQPCARAPGRSSGGIVDRNADRSFACAARAPASCVGTGQRRVHDVRHIQSVGDQRLADLGRTHESKHAPTCFQAAPE